MTEKLLNVNDVGVVLRTGAGDVEALRSVSMVVKRGELVGVVGPSGSGKSTLLRLAGCLLAPTRGNLLYEGVGFPSPTSTRGARFRNANVGFVLQEFALIESESALKNVELPLVFRQRSIPRRERKLLSRNLLESLGLGHRASAMVSHLSGGERQRVAIARALVNRPGLLVADEPTGSLDIKNTSDVISLLREVSRSGHGVLVATHDDSVAASCDRVLTMSDGNLRPA